MKQRGFTELILVLLVLLVLVGGGIFYLSNKQQTVLNKKESAPLPNSVDTVTAYKENSDGSKTYVFSVAKLQFKLPPKMAKETWLHEVNINTFTEGKMGCITDAELRVTSCYLNRFAIAASSSDAGFGRGADFMDMKKFEVKNGHYFVLFGYGDTEIEIPQDRAKVIRNQYGVDILKIYGSDNTDIGSLPDIWDLSGNKVGAVVNTNNPEYPGLAMIMKMGKIDDYDRGQPLTEED